MADSIHVSMTGNLASANPLLVVLPGALLDGPSAALDQLGARRPVLLVRYGRLRSMSELLDAIVRAVQDHGFESADVIGSSFGGWVAQCFARQNPGSVRRLVLSHTFVLRPSDAWKFRVALRVWRATPEWLLRSLISLRVRRSLAPLNRERTRDRYIETLTHVRSTLDAPEGLDMLMNQNACMLDSLTNASGVATPRQAGHPVLILESTDDPLISPSARRDLRAIYPDAIVHRFTGSGHVSALVDPDAFAGVVERFLDQP